MVANRNLKLSQKIHEKIASAHSIILAGPVYNYDLNAAIKNFIEWTGYAWNKKVVACMLLQEVRTPIWLLCHL